MFKVREMISNSQNNTINMLSKLIFKVLNHFNENEHTFCLNEINNEILKQDLTFLVLK